MAVRLSGLSSGLDTESIIKELMSVQSLKKTKVENKLTKLGWKEEKWKELNTKIYNLYKNELATLKTQSSYLTRSVTSSDSTKATFKASSSVPVGTHSLSISQVASSQFVTGIKVAATTKNALGESETLEISNATKITSVKLKNENGNESYIASGTVLNLKNVGDEEGQYYTVNETTTISDLTNWFKSKNISFTYDSNNQKFFISSMQSGDDNAFTLTSTENGIANKDDVLTYNVGGSYAFSALGIDGKANLEAALSAYKNTEVTDKKEAKAEIEKYGQANYIAKKEVYKEYITNQWKDIIGDKKGISLTWDDEGNWSLTKTNEDSSISLATYRKKLNEENSNYDYDKLMAENSNYREKYSAVYNDVLNKTYTTEKYGNSLILADNFSMSNTFTALEDSFSALDLLGIGEINSIPKDEETTNEDTTVKRTTIVAASNMICNFNGSEYKSSSNTLTINGLTINAIDNTESVMKITVSNDTSAVYDKIKSFVSKYNEVLGEINELYYAGSAKGYDVLTDEEREAMSDEQIEKWENKIKDSLLRRDSTLSSVMSSLRSITSKSVMVNDKPYSLSSYGINTTDYTEKGLLHIYGNESDTSVSGETDKLLAALSDDPDTVMQVFTGISNELYSTLSDKMSSTSLSSALTFYNDKEITSLKEDYQDEIDKWEDYLQELEDRYYSKFSAMETAMSKLNAQTSYISSLFSS